MIGLEFRGDDLYVLAAHGLYLVKEGRVKRTGLQPRRILWGVPLDFHVSFHCMAWGPDGDLYLDHGDPLLGYGDWTRPDHWNHWTLFAGPNGEKVPYTGTGAVLKVRPDGSQPRVVARGLRGPVGLAFDRHWNLFTNDNDHESRADQFAPIRLLHVTPQADFAWPRGWMASKSPDRADLLDSIHPALGRGVPCDLACADDNSLLMARWDRSAVTRYPLTKQGSTFTAEEQVFAQGSSNSRPTGVTVDDTGRVFVTSLYLAGNVVSPHCPSDLSVIAPEGGAKPDRFDETRASDAALWRALDDPSWDRRRRAHQELLRRGIGLETAIVRLATLRDTEPAAAHLPWLAAATRSAKARETLQALARDSSRPGARIQALRALAAFRELRPDIALFTNSLTEADPVIRLAGLEGLFASSSAIPVDLVASVAATGDLALRQTATTLLARRATIKDLTSLAQSSQPRQRMMGVLALGTALTAPRPEAAAPAGVSLFLPKASSFFNPVMHFADADSPVNLSELGPVGSYTTAQWWAATRTLEQETLFASLVAALSDSEEAIRLQAAYYLAWLKDERSEPLIHRTRLEARIGPVRNRDRVAITAAWVLGRVAEASAMQTIERGPIDLAATVSDGSRKITWETCRVVDKALALPESGRGSAYIYIRLGSRERQTAMVTLGPDSCQLWHNGREIKADDGNFVLDLVPGSNDLLVKSDGVSLKGDVRSLHAVSVLLAEKPDGISLTERLKSTAGHTLNPEFHAIRDWAAEARQGNPATGRKLFGGLGCVKCHAISADQPGGGGPSLTDCGKRFAPTHLAESVLLPDRLVADEFRATRVITTDGRVLVGLVVRESATEIELLLQDTTRQTIKLHAIEERQHTKTSPMPASLVKTPVELRDILAYLLSDRPQPP